MLEFYYDFMDTYVCRTDFQYVEMDTDSAYMALSGDLESVVKPHLREQFYNNWGSWLPRPYCDHHRTDFIHHKLQNQHWHPSDCCLSVLKSDARTPGLFKEEFKGTGIVALNSKTYFCWNSDNLKSKYSCKGLNKRTNNLDADTYKRVLFSRRPFTGLNTGFIQKDHQTYTYQQGKTGLSFFYGKRFVCDDGISTRPINL